MQDEPDVHAELVAALRELVAAMPRAIAALAKAEEREDEERRELIDEQNLKYGGEPPMERED